MLSLSSKKSLLSGVSAVVLATTVGVSAVGVSGALAQAIVVDYEYDGTGEAWASGAERGSSDNSTDITQARAGDNLTLKDGGLVAINGGLTRENAQSIGVLKSGVGGGEFRIFVGTDADVNATIGEIAKLPVADRAIDLSVSASTGIGRRAELAVGGGARRSATVRNLTISGQRGTHAGAGASALFNGDLTVEGTTQIKAGNNSTGSIDATLELKGAVNKFAQDITLDDQAGGRAYLTLSGGANQTIGRVSATGTNRIKAASDGEGTIRVLNGRDGQSPSRATFDIDIGTGGGSAVRLKQLVVGESSKGGHAIFNRGVHVDEIDVIAGDGGAENAVAEFRSDVSGKGFIVVANEVKSLANQTSNATNDIRHHIEKIQGATEDSAKALHSIARTISEISDISGTINNSVEEQSKATREIAESVEQAANGTSEVSANIAALSKGVESTGKESEMIFSATNDLLQKSEQLKDSVSHFLTQINAS